MRENDLLNLEKSTTVSEENAVFGALIHDSLRAQLECIFETLSDREIDIIKMRFGFEEGGPMTLQEIAERHGISSERVRQIEAKTMKKLRHPSRSQAIRDYLDD
jgi:RNA polymerase primary sigma factor